MPIIFSSDFSEEIFEGSKMTFSTLIGVCSLAFNTFEIALVSTGKVELGPAEIGFGVEVEEEVQLPIMISIDRNYGESYYNI